MDVSILEFMDMVAVDEECVLMERVNEETVKVVFIGLLEECLERFEDGKHQMARKSDIEEQLDKQEELKKK